MDRPRPFTGRLKIILLNKATDTCPTLSADHVNKIPPKMLERLFRDFATEDLGDFGTVVRVADEKHYGTITQILQWVTKGEAADFLVSHKPQVLKREGDRKVTQFDPRLHADDASYCASTATQTCFAEEVETYLFSIHHELTDLQRHMSKKLQSYPIYEAEISNLIKQLYKEKEGASKHVDPALAQFVANRINCFRATLTTEKTLLASLRTCIPPRMEHESLLHHANISNDTMGNALHTLRSGLNEADIVAALLQTFEKTHLHVGLDSNSSGLPDRLKSDRGASGHHSEEGSFQASNGSYVNPRLDPRLAGLPPSSRLFNNRRASEQPFSEGHDQTEDAVKILNAIFRDKRVVRAEQDGSGTFRSTHTAGHLRRSSGDDRFRVSAGQYFVKLPNLRPQVQGSNPTRLVCNQYGEVGELFGNLSLTPIQDIQNPSPSPQRSEGNKRPRT